MDIDTIIERAGGVSKLAAILGISHPTVSGWKQDGYVPGARVRQISDLLGIPFCEMYSLVRPPRAAE
jgi:DNA-binding transcriptional regulator YdaS (Cro superfamily)